MIIKSIKISTLPPEIGPPGEHLIVLTQDDQYLATLIDKPLTTQGLAEKLEMMARELRKFDARPRGGNIP